MSSFCVDSKEVHSVNIENVNVRFPKSPYECQKEYMTCVIRTLNSSQNALLESPTGTGKTLSLLCSTLAWQEVQDGKWKAAIAAQGVGNQISTSISSLYTSNNNTNNSIRPSVIIYASRTHSQLSQVVRELKSTDYKPKMVVLGSRDQLCVQEKLSRFRGAALNQACNSLNNNNGCHYKNNMKSSSSSNDCGSSLPYSTAIMDIEDLAKAGKSGKFCPYFHSKDLSQGANLILLPYNYLLDATMRAKITVNWPNSVVIFDEAHNVEKVATDASSMTLNSIDLATCIEEMKAVLTLLRTKYADEMKKQVKDSSSSASSNKKDNEKSEKSDSDLPTLKVVVSMLTAVFEIEKQLDSVQLSSNGIGKTPSCILPGVWIRNLFVSSGFQMNLISSYVMELNRCMTLLQREKEDAQLNLEPPTVTSIALTAEPKLTTLIKALERVFRSVSDYNDYKVYICEKEHSNASSSTANMKAGVQTRLLHFWAFSSGIAMTDLKKLGVRSIIMTSGTLSPMNSFCDDMKLSFPIQLQNQHVITKSQVWLGAISNGISGKPLNSSFNNRDTMEYKDELGNSLLKICQTMVGNNCIGGLPISPELTGGILVFFPTYAMMNDSVTRWKSTGLYNKLVVVGGGVVVEPKASISSIATSNQQAGDTSISTKNKPKSTTPKFTFLEASSKSSIIDVNSNDDSTNDILMNTIAEFENTLKSSRRCLLLAVCRGKVSEGIDFSDDRGRVVIITGLPFAPYLDPWVVLKKQYLDERSSSAMTSNGTTSMNRLTGQQWYQQSAIRAVNQAIGRVIRHKNDWGAIFLMDNRFGYEQQKSQLSRWVRDQHHTYNDFVESMVEFRKFITSAMSTPWSPNSSGSVVPIYRKPVSRLESMPMKEHNNDTAIVTNETILRNSDILTQAEGTTYIHPHLLQTNNNNNNSNNNQSVIKHWTYDDDGDDDHNYNKGSMKKYGSILDGEDGLDIGKHFQRVSSSQSLHSIHGNNDNSNISISSSASEQREEKVVPTLNSIFGRSHRSNGLSTNKNASLEMNSNVSSSSSSSNSNSFGVASRQHLSLHYDNDDNKSNSSLSQSQNSTKKNINSNNNSSKFTLSNMRELSNSNQTATQSGSSKLIFQFLNSQNSQSDTKSRSSSSSFSSSQFSANSQEAIRKTLDSQEQQRFDELIQRATKTKFSAKYNNSQVEALAKDIVNSLFMKNKASSFVTSVVLCFQALLPLNFQDQFAEIVSALRETNQRKDRNNNSMEPSKLQQTINQVPLKENNKNSSSSSSGMITEMCGDGEFNENSKDDDYDDIVDSIHQTKHMSQIINSQTTYIPGSLSQTTINSTKPNKANGNSSSFMNQPFKPSKRALAMLDATKNDNNKNAQSIVKKSKLNDFFNKTNHLSSIVVRPVNREPQVNLFDKMDGPNLSLPKPNNNNQRTVTISSKLNCIICNDIATNPCAAKCGHICCEICWSQWLKSKLACPICKAPTTIDSISRIILS